MLEWGTQWFSEKGVASPRLSIEWLLADVLNIRRLNLYVQFDRPLSSDELSAIRDYVKRRARHEPLQYITGSTTFYNAEIEVGPGVLIPRSETEELVELILNRFDDSPRTVLDIGTGSGCIAVALAKARPEWNVHAVDISDEALIIARRNAEKNAVSVSFEKADLFKMAVPSASRWDIIVSNPPYIHHDESESLDPQVRNFEPSMALFCTDRISVYEHIFRYASGSVADGGKLYLELHLEHILESDPCFKMFTGEILIHNDMSERRRFAEISF